MMEKRILLVIGASSDIGLELISSVKDKYDVIIATYGKNIVNLNKLKLLIGDKLKLFQADLNNEVEIDEMLVNIRKEYNSVTAIVHLPAPKVKNRKFKKIEWGDFENNFNIQVRSFYKVAKTFLPEMVKKKEGKIVCVLSSYTTNKPPRYLCDYVTGKYALLGMLKSLAAEYESDHININAVSPSMIETKFLENVPDLIIEQSAISSPMKRNAKVEDVVPMIEYLLSEKSDYISGQNIVISGGNQ